MLTQLRVVVKIFHASLIMSVLEEGSSNQYYNSRRANLGKNTKLVE